VEGDGRQATIAALDIAFEPGAADGRVTYRRSRGCDAHLAPVVLGGGVRLLDNLDGRQFALERTRVVESDGVTHLWYRVVR
jgi:hypothetical protein